MKSALNCAKQAYELNEVPIGAVIVYQGEIIGSGYNLRESQNDVTSHAEINAIKEAAKHLQTWKLEGCDIYVTVKPCLMCYSAIEQSRIKNIYFGTDQYRFKKRAFDTLTQDNNINLYGPILEEECSGLMTRFFERMRNGKQ